MGQKISALPQGIPDSLDLVPYVDVSEPNPLLKNKAATAADLGNAGLWFYDIRSYLAVEGAALGTQHAEINAAIIAANAAGGGVVVVPPGVWMVDPDKNAGKGVRLLSNVTLWLTAGATLRSIATGLDLYAVVAAMGQTNVSVIGEGTIDGNRAAHIGTTGEWGMCLWITGCAGVKVRDIQCINGWGDGLYLGVEGGVTPNTNVDVHGVTGDNNRRNGCSVTGVVNGVIGHCWWINQNGTSPQAGIDLEPDLTDMVIGVIVHDCVALDNAGAGYNFTASSKNCRLHHNYGSRCARGGIKTGATGGGNSLEYNVMSGFSAADRGIYDIGSGTLGMRLIGNEASDIETGLQGIYVHSGALGTELYHNKVIRLNLASAVNNGLDCFAPDTIIVDNRFEDINGIGMTTQGPTAPRCRVHGNTALRTVGRAFYISALDNAVTFNTAIDTSAVTGAMFQFPAGGAGAQAIGNRAILTTPDTAVVPFLFTGAAAYKAGNIGIGTQAYTEPLVGVLSTAAQPNVTSLGILSSLTVSGTAAAGALSAGTNPAGAGYVRIPNNANMSARNGANTGDLRLVSASAADNLNLGSAEIVNLLLIAGAAGIWQLFGATGELGPSADNTYDLGKAAANRPRTGYFATSVVTKRLIASGGTAHVAGDYALSAGWGTTASVSAVAARDSGGRVTITCLGTGQAASPTVTLTFKDGTWGTPPALVAGRGDIASPAGDWRLTSISATVAVFTLNGTPVSGSVYVLDWLAVGK